MRSRYLIAGALAFAALLSAQTPARINVLLLLRHQPHTDLANRGPASMHREMMEARYQRVAGQYALDTEFKEAARALDEAIVSERTAILSRAAEFMDADQSAIESKLKALGATGILRYQVLNLIRAEIPAEALPALAADRRIADVNAVGLNESQINTSVRSLGASWFWNGGPQFTGKDQNVAILDSGVNGAHPALSPRVTGAHFLTPGSAHCLSADDFNDNLDRSGHGTHVAGIIASAGTTSFPTYLGVAFQTANIYSVKVGCTTSETLLPYNQAFYADDDLLQGLQYVIAQTPARIINISMGRRDKLEDSLLNRSIDSIADTYGVTIVVSAGNEGPTPVTTTSPGNSFNVIAVGAFNTQGTVERTDDVYAGWSSRGPTPGGRKKPDITAPGGRLDTPIGSRPLTPCPDGFPVCGIYSTDDNSSGFVALPGTSMAAAHITGSAVLLRQAGVTSALAVKALLLNTTDSVDWTPAPGWGYANLQTLRDQYTNYLLDTMPAGSFKLYRGTGFGALTATVVWNRRISSQGAPALSDLDLSIHNPVDNSKAAESASHIDNVEKTGVADSGAYVVKVRNTSAGSNPDQAYAIAFSAKGFAAIAGPALTMSCQAPYSAAPGAQFPVVCAARNTGDADAFNVTGTLGPQGVAPGTAVAFGNISPGGRATRTYSITAPTAPGSYTLRGDLTSSTFGENFTASTTVGFVSTNCTFGSSAAPTTFSGSAGVGTITVSSGPGCPVSVVSNSPWISVVSAAPGSYTFNVSANAGAQRTGSISAAGENIQILQHAATPTSAFTDVPVLNPFADYINLLRTNSVTSGCTQTTYCPDDNTTRGQMAVFIVRSLLGTDQFVFPITQIFDDVAANYQFFKYIQKLKDLGITSGCTATAYCPDALLARGQMAVFIVRGRLGLVAGQDFPFRATPYFQDVPANHPFFPFIQKMRELGITSGCTADRYCPDDPTTRAQMAAFLIRAFYTP